MATRFTNDMICELNWNKMLFTLCENDAGEVDECAFFSILELLKIDSVSGHIVILACDYLEIYDHRLRMLCENWCGRDPEKLKKTILALRAGYFGDKFSKKEIQEKLSTSYANPFI